MRSQIFSSRFRSAAKVSGVTGSTLLYREYLKHFGPTQVMSLVMLHGSAIFTLIVLIALTRMAHIEPVSLGAERGYQVYVYSGDLRVGMGLAASNASLSFGGGLTLAERKAYLLGVSIQHCGFTLSVVDDGFIIDWCTRSLTRLSDIRQFITW